MQEETDVISEALLAQAYKAGWDGWPDEQIVPWKWHKYKILQDAWIQGWQDHKEEDS